MSHERVQMNNTVSQDTLVDLTTDNNDNLLRTQHLLGELNNDEIHRLLPLSLYLVLISVIGIPGNAMVYYIYRTQYKRSKSKYFILCLSAIDLFTCLFVVPFELFTIQNQYTYTANIACKLARFCNSAPTITNGFMLLLIGLDRYRKVCQPLRWQIRPKIAKILSVGSVACGVLFSWPVLVLYGKKTFSVERLNVTASECSIDDSVNGTVFPFMFNSILGFLFIFGITTLLSLYAVIGRAISKHANDIFHFQSSIVMKTLRDDTKSDNYSLSQTIDSGEELRKVEDRSREGHNGNRATLSPSIENAPSDVILENNVVQDCKGSTETTLDRTTLSKRNKNAKSVSFWANSSESKTRIYKKSPNRSVQKDPKRTASYKMRLKRSRKMSVIMFLITLSFIVSYLPFLSLVMTRAISSDFVRSMSDGERAVYKFFLRSYFFNCFVNPFIYSACDVKFRNGVKQLLRAIVGGFCNAVSRRRK